MLVDGRRARTTLRTGWPTSVGFVVGVTIALFFCRISGGLLRGADWFLMMRNMNGNQKTLDTWEMR